MSQGISPGSRRPDAVAPGVGGARFIPAAHPLGALLKPLVAQLLGTVPACEQGLVSVSSAAFFGQVHSISDGHQQGVDLVSGEYTRRFGGEERGACQVAKK